MADPTLPKASPKWLEVSLFWGETLLDVQTFAPGQAVRLGPGFQLEGPLAVPNPGEQRVLYAGHLCLVLRCTDAVPRPPGALVELDVAFTELLGLGLLLHAMLLVGIQITPTTDELPSERLFGNPADIAKVLVRPPKQPVVKFPALPARSPAKPKGAAGKFGVTRALRAEADPSKKGSPHVDPKRRERDRTRVLATGLLGALADNSRAASDVFGPGGVGDGLNRLLGGLRPGAGLNSANGIGGLTSRGTGPGGGGQAESIGGLGTRPGGRGGGGPELGLGSAGKSPLRIIPDKRSIGVALDKGVIASVIRRHWNEIKYCYETQLNQDPSLAGKVAVAFTIGGTGAVTEARVSESSLGGPRGSSVEDCMVKDIGRWRFPEPKGGGEVFVSYPWVFKAAGAEE